MDTLTQKFRNANYAKLFKWWLILGICAGLLGGGLSALLLRPQIQEAIVAEQARESTPETARTEGERHGEHHWEELAVSEPSTAAKVAVGFTAAAAILFAVCCWLFFAGWLFQQAERSHMHGLLWGLLALGGNVFAAVLFFLVRSFSRRKCAGCGTWQRKGSFCRNCGHKLILVCPGCGGKCAVEDRFCGSCGASLAAPEA